MSASRATLVSTLGLALLFVCVALSLAAGVIHVPLGEVLRALRGGLEGSSDGSLSRTLVLEMRLPRGLAAASVGAALGTAGCLLQALLRDPLASPTMIGTAQASGFGRVLGVYLGFSFASSVALAFLAATLGTLLVLYVSRARRGFASQIVLLTGINVGMLFMALIGLVQYSSRDEGQLSRMVLLLLGGLWQVSWEPLRFVLPVTLVAVVLAQFGARSLDLFSLGEANADRLGLATRRAGPAILALACLLTSLAVSIAGVIAFVGLIVPHAARRLVGPAHAVLLPASAALGGALLVLIDCIARTAVAPNELPLGVLTSLVGVPLFLMLLRSMARRGAAR
ncbi:MAG: iron ABC transporter permease [Planctomycetes bacterium]|nr:iron ABC transporter permease [Planctomycetota bacterium]